MPESTSTINETIHGCGQHTVPTAAASLWFDITTAGGPEVQDNSGAPQDPTEDIAAGKHTFQRTNPYAGTTIQLRLKYPEGVTVSQQLQVALFGWSVIGSASDAPGLLTNANGVAIITITAAPSTDAVTDGYCYTTVDLAAHTFDCQNNTTFRAAVVEELAHNGTAGLSVLQARWL